MSILDVCVLYLLKAGGRWYRLMLWMTRQKMTRPTTEKNNTRFPFYPDPSFFPSLLYLSILIVLRIPSFFHEEVAIDFTLTKKVVRHGERERSWLWQGYRESLYGGVLFSPVLLLSFPRSFSFRRRTRSRRIEDNVSLRHSFSVGTSFLSSEWRKESSSQSTYPKRGACQRLHETIALSSSALGLYGIPTYICVYIDTHA